MAGRKVTTPGMARLVEYVRRCQKESGLSDAEIARRSNGLVSQTTVSRTMSGATVPELDTLIAISVGLGVPLPSAIGPDGEIADPGGESTIPRTCGGEAQNGVCAWHVS